MGVCDPISRIWTKSAIATTGTASLMAPLPLGPHNAVFFDGTSSLWAQPNWDFTKGAAVGAPAPGGFYVAKPVGAA